MFKSSKVKKASSLVIMAAIAARPSTHMACRSFDPTNLQAYQVGKDEKLIIRPFIPREKVNWNVDYLEYKPINYTSPIVMANPPWADPVLPTPDTKWNSFDGKIDRRSHFSKYEIVNGLPRNPVGRTGITGRGLLGRWGPNHAADPIVTRWKLDKNGSIERDLTNNKPILQFVAIQRVDTNEWAIPGGMCDPGEKISNTMKREFMEEALNSEKMGNEELNEYKKKLENLFKDGIEVYRGYVDDPRNTDNAWMETVASNFHDDGHLFYNLNLSAGDDAKCVKWMDINSKLKLYASHKNFIREVALKHNASW